MLRIKICITLIVVLIGCSVRPIPPFSRESVREQAGNATPTTTANVTNPLPSEQRPLATIEPPLNITAVPTDKNELLKFDQQLPLVSEPSLNIMPLSPKKSELLKPGQLNPPSMEPSPKKTPSLTKKSESLKTYPMKDQPQPQFQESRKDYQEEAERDIMEEALILLDESHSYWVNGDLENALEILDQVYALLLDTNGNPDIARQKDDLRLMISKRILAIYNSIQANAKGIRSEIPLVANADVEKEIRQFQTVERDFFISSYQRSAMYRPIILRELKKAGLPEELSWLPLVESGFKINALSTARALGLWQFIPSTGYKYGLNRDDWIDERMDIEKSTHAAIEYLKELHTMFGDWLTVLAAYNCGEGRVMRTISAQHINYLDRFWDLYHQLPYETARYVPRFLATLLIVRDPQKYGIDLGAKKMSALSYEIAEINKSMRLQDIAQKLEIPEEILNILNAELRHRITPDKPYKLKVPMEMAGQLQKVVDEILRAETPRDSFLTKRGLVIKHKVRQGETIDLIARKYKTTVGAIRTLNHLSKKGEVVAGQRLTVPIQGTRAFSANVQKTEVSVKHKVQKGDTLAFLAKKYGTGISEIKKANRLGNDTLKTGQILLIKRVDVEASHVNKKDNSEKAKSNVKQGPEMKSIAGKTTKTTVGNKYTVKKGDSLNKIAREKNMTLNELRQLNGLAHRDNIHPGQVILVK